MKAILLAALFLAVLFAGCSSRPDDYPTPSKDAEGNYVITAATPANRFNPAKAAVPAGSTVLWHSEGVHDVTALDKTWKSEILMEDQHYSRRFDQPGTYKYECTLHSGMTGVLKVE